MKKRFLAAVIAGVIMLAGCGESGDGGNTGNTGGSVTSETTEPATEIKEVSIPGTGDAENDKPAEGSENGEADTAAPVSAQSVYDAVEGAVTLPEMVMADDDYLMNYYGIAAADLDNYVFAEAMEATRADKVIIIKPAAGADVEKLKGQLETVRSQKEQEMQDYLPDQYDIVKKASVKTAGDFIILVVSPDASDIEKVIENAATAVNGG